MIVAGLDLRDRRVLDIGSGLGGPALVLAGELGARVTGVDVQAEIVEDARRRVAEAGLAERIDVRLAEPGPLPFPDGAFDVAFSKDSLIHVPDKPMIYGEMFRVLRPGGVLAVSDWLTGPADDPAVAAFLAASPIDLGAATLDDVLPVIAAAGFEDIATTDRAAWYARIAREEQEAIRGPLGMRFEALIGREAVEAWHARREPLRIAAEAGALRPTHIRARRAEG
jgi:phosphoethanolamine N-methyltransferase